MKKLIAILLSLTFVLSVSALAVTLDNEVTSNSKDVFATYIEGTDESTVYSVDLQWGNLEFDYNEGSVGTWLPNKHEYSNTVNPGWTPSTPDSNQISITNHSNSAVTCIIEYTSESTYSGVSGFFDYSEFELPSAVNKSTDSPDLTKVATLTLSGNLITDLTGTKLPIGTVTVSIQSA